MTESWCWAVAGTALGPGNSLWNIAVYSDRDVVKRYLNLPGKEGIGHPAFLALIHHYIFLSLILPGYFWNTLPHWVLNSQVISHKDAFEGFGFSYFSFRKRKAEKRYADITGREWGGRCGQSCFIYSVSGIIYFDLEGTDSSLCMYF